MLLTTHGEKVEIQEHSGVCDILLTAHEMVLYKNRTEQHMMHAERTLKDPPSTQLHDIQAWSSH